MAASAFSVRTYTFEAQHLRHYPAATRNGESDVLYLEAKQYIPLNNQTPRDGDVTIIGAHGTSFPKELYEPLWEDLFNLSEKSGFRIRSIWIVDASNHGASGVLNEATQGDDPSFSDYARDMLHMVNVFREHMIQPIVGIGHSLGATALIELSCMHPRLLASLAIFDPIVGEDTLITGIMIIYLASVKQDLWPSREAAEQVFRKTFRNWDPRVLDRWMRYGLRETPTLLYPEPGKVTLRMSKAQEAWSYSRSFFDDLTDDGKISPLSRYKYPDAFANFRPFYRTEVLKGAQNLPYVRPDLLFLWPEKTPVPKTSMDHKVAMTGTGLGGSGGAAEGRVEQAIVKRVGHLGTFEKPAACAAVISEWLGRDLKAWRERTEYEKSHRDDKSIDQIKLSDEWIRHAKEFFNAHMPKRERKQKL